MASFVNYLGWLQTPSTPPRVSTHPRLRMSAAHDIWNHEVEALVAIEKGYFREEGLEDVELIAFANDEDAQIDALVSGFVDVALDPTIRRVLVARDKGADIYIVVARRKMHNFIIFGQKWMKSLEDLRGQTLHLHEEGAPSVQLKQVLKMAGLEWGKDVMIVNTPFNAGAENDKKNFLQGKRLIISSNAAVMERWSSMGYPILADTRELLPARQDRVVAAGKMAEERPDTLKAFLKGYIKASQFIMRRENFDEIKTIVERAGFLKTDKDRESFLVKAVGWEHRKSHDGTVPLGGVEQAIKELREEEALSDRISVDKVVKLEALSEAQRELEIQPK